MSTKNQILSLLRREQLTVNEISARLRVSRNAVIVPLKQLEASGLVEAVATKGSRVGKPATVYAVVPGIEDIASQAYPAFAALLTEAVSEQFSRQQVEQLMKTVGRKMAASLNAQDKSSFADRVQAATDFVDSVGAETVVESTKGGCTVRSYSCPLARAVRQDACVCSAVASFFSCVTGTKVDEQCERGNKLLCKFVISKRAAG